MRTSKDSTDIVFIHLGYSSYLYYVLAQAKFISPMSTITLIGDDTALSPVAQDDRIRKISLSSLSNNYAEEFRHYYRHLSSNQFEYELFCWLRWFYLLEYMKRYQPKLIFYFDSDVLLNSSTDDIQVAYHDQLKGCGFLIKEQEHNSLHWVASGHISYWNFDSLEAFCRFSIDSFAIQKNLDLYIDKYNWHTSQSIPGGVCDMTTLYLFWNTHKNQIQNLAVEHNGHVFDNNINRSDNYQDNEYVMDFRKNIKKVQFWKKSPYLIKSSHSGRDWEDLVKVHAIHFQGDAKRYIPSFYIGDPLDLILPRESEAEIDMTQGSRTTSLIIHQANQYFRNRQFLESSEQDILNQSDKIEAISIQESCSSIIPIFSEELFTMPKLHEYGKGNEGVCFKAYHAQISAYNLYVLPQGKIFVNGEEVFTKDNQVVQEITSQRTNPFIGQPSTILKNPKVIRGKILHLSLSGLENNYYHFTVEFLARWYLWLRSGVEYDWITFPLKNPFHLDCANLLGIDFNKILPSENLNCIQADEILIPSMINNWNLVHYKSYPHALKIFLPSWLTQCHSLIRTRNNQSSSNKIQKLRDIKRIYISRKKASYRYVLNEDSLSDIFVKYQILPVVLEDLSLAEQIILFSDLEIVISPHGAGLVNISYSQNLTKILEIYPYNYHDSSFRIHAKVFGHHYDYLIGEKPQDESLIPRHENIYIDTNRIDKWLSENVSHDISLGHFTDLKINMEVEESLLTTPIVFLIFNRPDTTARVFETIRQAKPTKLLIVADGPRSDRPDDVENCKAARAIVEQIDWDCEVFKNYSEVNLGCRKRVISGLDWVFEQVEEAIILEDDCLPHPTFFRYCQELLEKYRNDRRIMMISGNNFQFGRNKTEYSYYFSRYSHIWGWASWRRSWLLFDNLMPNWPELRDREWLFSVFNNQRVAKYWSHVFQIAYDGFDTWDFTWLFTLWFNNQLAILPDVNLVSNIGFGSGTHTTMKDSPFANMEMAAMNFPLSHPIFVQQYIEADNFTEYTQFSCVDLSIKLSHPLILIDGVFFQMYSTGIARVWRSLLEEWAKADFANHILVLDRGGNSAPKIDGIKYRSIPLYDYGNTEADKQMLQEICNQENANLFISTYYTTPLETPSVFMAYDMIPEVTGANLNDPMWREKHHAIQHASGYLSISANTADDLSRSFTGIDRNAITIAHCGVNPSFVPASSLEIDSFKYKYGIQKPYFLLGNLTGYKNGILFFQAFQELVNRHQFEIVCTGSGSRLPNEWRSYTSGCVVHNLYLSDEELRLAYAGAIALVYPSKYEGFGMPIVEAMACGCPVITTRNGSIPEVAGDAALYVGDDDMVGLADALCEVQKPRIRRSLIDAGLAQAQKFSWQKMATIVQEKLLETASLKMPRHNKAIVTLAIGDRYQTQWDRICRRNWKRYADRHGYDLICITKPLDQSERAQKRSPAWQKCLILSQDFSQSYERIVWIDADILINPNAPCISQNIPIEKVGAVEDFIFPTPDVCRKIHNTLMKRVGSNLGEDEDLVKDFYTRYGLPDDCTQVFQTGVLVLSPSHHREILESVYYTYEDAGSPEMNYEMRPLSYELVKNNLLHPLNYKFNTIYIHHLALQDPNLINTNQERLNELTLEALQSCYFLHFASIGWSMSFLDMQTIQDNLDAENLLDSSLETVNYLIFPDWQTSEDELGLDFALTIQKLTPENTPENTQKNDRSITLFIDITGTTEDEANLFLSSVALNLMMEEDLEISENLNFSFIHNLSTMEWDALLPQVLARIQFAQENLPDREAIESLPVLSARCPNYLICPDWHQPSDRLTEELSQRLIDLSQEDENEGACVLIDITDMDPETITLYLSELVMTVLLNEGIDLNDRLQISLIGDLSTEQWESLKSLVTIVSD